MIMVSIINIIAVIPTKAAVPSFSSSLGTNKALGSPLVEKTFTEEDWNKWEMLTFGIFLSNFATPFIDSYRTAFSSGYGGSEGSGRRALVFAAGGDVNSESIVSTMLGYCINLQQDISKIKELKVDYSFYNYNKLDSDRTDAFTSKTATLRDILVMVLPDTLGIRGSDYADGDFPYVITNKGQTAELHDYYTDENDFKIKSSTDVSDDYDFEYAKEAALSRLFFDNNGKEITLFDMSDGYDIQILSALLAAVIESCNNDREVINILENSKNYNLYMDSFGNICIIHNGEIKIVIPSAVNQHLTKDKRYNFLNSMVLNGNYISEDDHTIAAGLEATNESGGIAEDWLEEIRGGNSGSDGSSEGIKNGQLIIFEDTDIELAQEIYKIDELGNENEVYWEDLHLGEHIVSLIESKQQRGKINKPLKIEVVGGVNESAWGFLDGAASGGLKVDGENIINRMAQAAAVLSNAFPMETNREVLNWMHSFTTEPMNLFGDQIYVANSIPKSKNIQGGKNSNEGVKTYINFYFNYITKANTLTYSGLDIPTPESQLENIKYADTPRKMAGLLFNGNPVHLQEESAGSDILVYYLWTDRHYGPEKDKKLADFKRAKLQDYAKYLKNVSMWGKAQFNYEGNMVDSMRRIIKVYKKNSSLSIASDYLSLTEGTEFSTYATLIYLTYLDFYGILDGEDTHNFNVDLFGNSGFAKLTPETALGKNVISEEDQKKQILKNTYLLLSPEGGRDYRNKLITNWFEDWMHQEYQSICYGDASTSVVLSSISTRLSKGFLQIDTYEDNFLTSWFLENYSKIVIILMGIFIVIAIVVGIIKGQKFSWFIVSLGTIVLVFSLAPSTGEVTPYICNNMIQKMFSENMTYWAMSESIENATVESQYNSGGQQDKEVLSLINSLDMLFLDKTIMIKKDISKKVVEKMSVEYGEIQRLKSTRWLLPTLMQQISADDRSADYVYTTLTDLYSDMRSGYWLYARSDIAETPVTQFVEPSKTYTAYSSGGKVGSLWEGYTDTSYIVDLSTITATSTLTPAEIGAAGTSKAISRIRDDSDNNFHTLSYLIDTNAIDGVSSAFKIVDPLTVSGHTEYSTEMWGDFANSVINSRFNLAGISDSDYKKDFQIMTQQLIEDASTYNSYDTEPKQSFGYLWMTETPSHFFYQLVKDTFKENDEAQTLAMLIKQLQGIYEENADGVETRRTFMHKGDTGHIRDFLDLEELFTNVIPYMYTIQVLAGGEDGTNGILGTELMENYPIYENNMQSWLYRSNWVTKLVEYPLYADSTVVTGRDANGNKVEYEIASPLYPQNYPDERPMVFSEAQMYEQGLNESDLSVVELKLLKINKEVEKSWTLLINYANTKGISKEVFYRQMAISALLAFNNHMSPDNWVSSSRALYPTSLDLRNISFDAVMKMIILSDTANSAYMSNDTMFAVIADGDTLSGLLLLGTAWMASYAVPFLRELVIGLMFYLGLLSMLMGLFRDNKKAVKSAGGYIVSNILFMIITVAYYAIYAFMITTSTVDSVLSVKNISMTTSVPTWKFLIVFIASVGYMVIIIKYLNFIWKNYRDMGFEIYAGIANTAAGRLSDSIEQVGNRLSGNTDDYRGSRASTGGSNSSETKVTNTSDEPLKVQTVDSEVSVNNLSKEERGVGSSAGESGYMYDSSSGSRDNDVTAQDIDRAINEGKQKK